MRKTLWECCKATLGALFWAAALEVCHRIGWYPEIILADFVMENPTLHDVDALYWVLIATLALLLLFAEHLIAFSRRLTPHQIAEAGRIYIEPLPEGALFSGSIAEPRATLPAGSMFAAADVVLHFKWENEPRPEDADFRFRITAVNRGPGDADISEAFADFRDDLDGAPDFQRAKPNALFSVVPPNGRTVAFRTRLPDGREGQYCYGLIRWRDSAGHSFERVFCVQPRVHPDRDRNELHFTTVGGTGTVWNNVREL